MVKLQEEALNIPEAVEKLLNVYATRFNEIKTPRKLLWKKNLGTVKVRCYSISIDDCHYLELRVCRLN